MTSPQPISDAALGAIRLAVVNAKERAARRRKVWQYRLHAAVLFPIIALLRSLPVDSASAFGGWIGRQVLGRLLNFEKLYVTVRVPFPELSDKQIDVILTDMSENIGRVLAETVHLLDFAGPGNPRLVVSGLEHLEAARADGKGLMLIGGHFANWELYHVGLRGIGEDGLGVLQHPSNPGVIEWLARQRYSAGYSEQVGMGEGVYLKVRRKLKAGGNVHMVADQRVVNGVQAPFFGLDTMTNVIPARVAHDLGTPIVPMSMARTGGAQFTMRFLPPLRYVDTGDALADERELTGRMNAFFAGEITVRPGFWLWGHPRWHDALLGLKPRDGGRHARSPGNDAKNARNPEGRG